MATTGRPCKPAPARPSCAARVASSAATSAWRTPVMRNRRTRNGVAKLGGEVQASVVLLRRGLVRRQCGRAAASGTSASSRQARSRGGRSTRIPVPAAVAWRGMQVQWRRTCCQHLAAVSLTVAVRVRTTSHAGASWGPGKNLVFRQKSGTAAAERAPAARPEPHEAGVCAPTRMSRKAEAPAAASGRFQLVGGAPGCAVTAEG